MGADEVVGISRKASKRDEAMALGCDAYIATEDDKEWTNHNARRFDVIISTVSSAQMPIDDYIQTLTLNGSTIQVGAPEEPVPVPVLSLIAGRRSLAGSAIGSPKIIREMLEFAVNNKVKPFVEMRPMSDANQAIIDMEAGKARFRYVLVNESHQEVMTRKEESVTF
ncbi:Alcohol dehydrogenase superfamily, zinc-type [Akanthomyces lecanii RCEF 1005]|uniref:Alcohol dehydrogenase superfamily, zinc-type n=1 Tax=Akanthomyces lecanii RCEF 1005 TaxID=1081108 RepID=A0A167THK5_CORDF|nr:Alcohol dehydrogenase superfamily, zinc-type [Akanthomyces lecanii RCEF 1005]